MNLLCHENGDIRNPASSLNSRVSELVECRKGNGKEVEKKMFHVLAQPVI